MIMNAEEILEHAHDTMSVKRVFGEPYEKDGVTMVPAATINGGVGSGSGEGPEGKGGGSGGGYGVREKPAGAFVIKEGQVRWVPSVDVNRIVLGAQLVAMAALFVAAMRARAKARRG
jgi:uncharacterized spore protein YtfJ